MAVQRAAEAANIDPAPNAKSADDPIVRYEIDAVNVEASDFRMPMAEEGVDMDVSEENMTTDFEELFQEFYPAVLSLFRRWGFSPPEVEELAQETFLQVHLGLARYRGEAKPWTWIWSIASNVYRNELRRRKARRLSGKEVSLEKPLGDGDESATELQREVRSTTGQAEQEVAAREDLKLVNGAVGCLPPRMREVFCLRMVDGLKYDAIAEQTNVSVQTVKSQVHQARRRLLSHLKERNEP